MSLTNRQLAPLVLLIIPFVLLVLCMCPLHPISDLKPTQITDARKLPEVIRESLKTTTGNRKRLDAWDLHGFLNNERIVLVEGDVTFVSNLINRSELSLVAKDHPILARMTPFLRNDCPQIDPAKWDFYATQDYGHKHLEGQDLIFLATNCDRTVGIVYYEWML